MVLVLVELCELDRGLGKLIDGALGRGVAVTVAYREHLEGIAHLDVSRLADHGKDALAREDAVAGQVVDGAAGVTDLADLADLELGVACAQPGSHGERQHVEAAGGEVLAKVARLDVEPGGLCLGD